MTLGTLRILVLASAAFAFAALILSAVRTLAVGRIRYLSDPRGSARKGVAYAFGRGMFEKESVALHRPSFAAGLLYHAAICAAMGELFRSALIPDFNPPLWRRGVQAILLAGTAAGLGLFFKRALKPHLRKLSCPDDYFANLIVNGFLIIVSVHTVFPGLESILFASAILLFIYIPLGKIRHCIYFFFTRISFGLHFGRRGALPGSSRKA